MTYLITGGCGFVGSNIASKLIQQGAQLAVLDNMSRAGASANLEWLKAQGTFDFIQADVRDSQTMDSVVRRIRPGSVFHLAGQVAMTTSMQQPRLDFETNVVGSLNLLEAVRQYSPESAIVYASSNKVYGSLVDFKLLEALSRYSLADGVPGIDESARLEFQTPYGCSKGAADQYMLDYARCFGLNTVVFRHSTIYGGRQFSSFDQGWVGWFCRQAIEVGREPEREPFTISGDGKQVRDLLHCDDAVRCYLLAASRIAEVRGQAFNIGGGLANSLSLLELLSFLESRFGLELSYRRLPWRMSDQRYFVADCGKACRLLDWQPLVNRNEGLNRIIDWEVSRAGA